MEYLIPILIILLISGFIAWRWVCGLDYMITNHPDYKGDDLFGIFDEDDKNQIM
jgi:hypothetical protein